MELTDKDLASIQQVRQLLAVAKKAQLELAKMSQEQIDRITKAISDAGYANAEKLARMANKETGFGKWEDKIIKNVFASKVVYEAIKSEKTVGIIAEDAAMKTMDIGIPVGVVAGIVPSTNPTSTVIYKAMISIKGGNSIVFSPHPSAKECIEETVKIISAAAEAAGCPKGAIATITIPTLEATNELMRHKNTALILATGGPAMVKAAYSSGTPAIGVGAGNGPAFIDKSADVKLAVKRILDSKTFDNGTICASEQSIIIEKCMEDKVVSELKAQGAYMLSEEEAQKLAKFVLRPNGSMNPQIVGKSVEHVAKLAGLTNVPNSARVLIARESRVGHDVPYSREKLGLILAFYVEDNVDAVLQKSIQILELEGSGHTYSIHANDHELVKRFSLKIPASRILINTPSALGGIGGSTNLFPALTLGCGAVGGSSTTNNIGPLDLINVKRVAYGVKEIEELRAGAPGSTSSCCSSGPGAHDEIVDLLVKKIMAQLV
ncbi:MAG: acetaldehyde dehydrogenase (acetylating) [Cellulosilyticaceae bacterium]